jgi:hypothetical protein
MDFDIEFINETEKTVDYSNKVTDNQYIDAVELYTNIFEVEYGVADGEDIGGLIVYGRDGKLQAVYDYENFCGWVV